MECVCDYDEPYKFYKERDVKAARKAFKCCECCKPISAGEPYKYFYGFYDGDGDTYRLCRHCNALKEYVEAHLPCFCWYWGSGGEMLHQMREAVSDYCHEAPGMWMEFGRLYVKATKPEWRGAAD